MTTMKRCAHSIHDVVDGTLVVCDLRSGELYELNATGRLIWEFFDGRTPEAIAQHVQEHFATIAPDVVADDVATYLSSLQRAGLAERTDS